VLIRGSKEEEEVICLTLSYRFSNFLRVVHYLAAVFFFISDTRIAFVMKISFLATHLRGTHLQIII